MPSIPQSLLWISLVVLWLFVLVPMLISKRDAVRRTSDVALATRVVSNGGSGRLLKRGGPAAGHRSDPDWRPEEDLDDDYGDEDEDEGERPSRTVVVAAKAAAVEAETDYLDVDVIDEDSGALPVGASASAETEIDELTLNFDDTAAEAAAVDDVADDAADDSDEAGDGTEDTYDSDEEDLADEYEYTADSPVDEAPSDDERQMADTLGAARRRRHDSTTAAAVSARKYKFRKRALAVLGLILVASAAAAYLVAPWVWWVCGSATGVTLMYLGYLRRQTRIEARLRRRRAQRMARSRVGVENVDDREFDVVPSRLRRPGSVVLEIDDEDPIFEHLDYASFAREYDLPRAAGQ
jgi:hypothetical protein